MRSSAVRDRDAFLPTPSIPIRNGARHAKLSTTVNRNETRNLPAETRV